MARHHHRQISRGILALCCALFAWPAAVFATPASEALKREGVELLKADHAAAAIDKFRAAMTADPADRDAAFLLGAAFNRLGDFPGAYVRLKALEETAYRNREFDFEIGWSLLGMGRAGACIARLERYEESVPGRAITSELLGRCHLLQRNFDKAEARLREALKRDAGAKPRIDLYLAQVQYGRGDRAAAEATLMRVTQGESDIGRALRDGQAALSALAPPPELGLRLAATAAFGYNDNVIGLGNTQPLPADITRKGSAFFRGGFGVSYTHAFDAQTRASAGYGGLIDRYSGIKAADLDDHFFYADVAHRYNEKIALSLRASVQVTYVSGSLLRTQPMLRPAAAYRWSDSAVSELSYTYARPDYALTLAPQFERDGHAHALSLGHLIRPAGSPWSLSLGYSRVENRPQGGDFQSAGDSLSAAVRYEFNRRMHLTIAANGSRERYDNLNSAAGFAYARRDNPIGVSAQFTAPLTERLRYFVQVQSSRSRANIPFYDYKQQSVVAGIAAEF